MKVASLFSGGKDSTYALWYAQCQGWDVEALVTVFPEAKDSWMFHYPAVRWTGLQAEAAGIPHVRVQTLGTKEKELEDLKLALSRLRESAGIDGIISGAIDSEYQKTRLDNLCDGLGLKSFAPLWHKDQIQLLTEQIQNGFEAIITACSALGLDESWLGKRLDSSKLKELIRLNKKYGLSVAFEGGEAETFTLASPAFQRRLRVVKETSHWKGDSGYLDLDDVQLR